MDFLQLCKDTRRECGIAGTGPTAVTGQVGELERVVAWVAQSWTEIQNRYPNWKWMRSQFTLPTIAATDSYAYGSATDTRTALAIARFKRWWWSNPRTPMKIYLQADGVATERYLIPISWDRFKRIYKIGSQTDSYPVHVAVDDQDNLVFGPRPNAVYVVSGDFQRSAQVLSANADTPDVKTDYHMLIVYEAMKKYAGYEAAPEVMSRGVVEGNKVMRQLEHEQMPKIELGGALA